MLHLLHGDHLLSTALTTNSSGSVYASQGYYAYGRYRTGGTLPTDHKFTGQKLDGTGLYYYGARYYNPDSGQFLGCPLGADTLVPDPTNLFDYNRLMYVRGNPLKYVDPDGHSRTCPETYCNAQWYNYSDTSGIQNGALDVVLTVGCFFMGCHVDRESDTVTGPTTEEYAAVNSGFMLGMAMPISLVEMPAAPRFSHKKTNSQR